MLKHARGTYQRDILEGRARWSGSDLIGKAGQYRGRYKTSRENLAARLVAAGHVVETRTHAHGLIVLYVDGAPASATS